MSQDEDGGDGECVDEHDGAGGAEEADGAPEEAEQQSVERELRVHQDLRDGVGHGIGNAELRLVRQHGERRDEAQAEEASGAEQGSDFCVMNGELGGDDAGEDERPDDAPGEGGPAAAFFAGAGFLPRVCFCA